MMHAIVIMNLVEGVTDDVVGHAVCLFGFNYSTSRMPSHAFHQQTKGDRSFTMRYPAEQVYH